MESATTGAPMAHAYPPDIDDFTASYIAAFEDWKRHDDPRPGDEPSECDTLLATFAYEGAKAATVTNILGTPSQAALAALIAYDEIGTLIANHSNRVGREALQESEVDALRTVFKAVREIWRFLDQIGGAGARPIARWHGLVKKEETDARLVEVNAHSEWTAAMAHHQAARAELVAYDAAFLMPACSGASEGGSRVPDEINDESERLTGVWCDALEQLIAMPAPDMAAAIWKIEVARERWKDSCDWPDEWWQAVMRDLRRFEGIMKESA